MSATRTAPVHRTRPTLRQRLRCFFLGHDRPMQPVPNTSLRWSEFYCRECGRLLCVRDDLTGATYRDHRQFIEEMWPNV